MSRICGCYIYDSYRGRIYLPQIELDAHTTILSTASRTVLTQTFINDSKDLLQEIRYAFPLYDGVSVVDFYCQVGERTIYGLVKEKNEARKTYEEAKARGENAALLEQLPDAADVFTTTISNIPQGASVQVTIKYVQELKHDAEVDGVRLNIPTSIAPRYGSYSDFLHKAPEQIDSKGMKITVDIDMIGGTSIKKIISPSHPIQVTLGSLSSSTEDEDQSLSRGSATLALGTVELEQDFVLQVVAKDVGAPQAILETHPTLPNQRALMATLVPKFSLKSEKPEIILIADRSGSMQGPPMTTLKAALKVFLKSIPLGCTFNICSFGSQHQFLWDKSELYDEDTLAKALAHVNTFEADLGGTETLDAIKGCFKNRSTDSPTEMILLTDGDIWQQGNLFDYVRQETKSGNVRIFPLGIGGGVSSALIEGVARAGRGFAQMVAANEKMDSKIVRMLKGALTPHIDDYRLEVKYEDGSVNSVADSLRVHLNINDADDTKDKAQTQTQPISLYDPEVKEEHPKDGETADIFAGLPDLKRPILLQTPHEIPALFPFHRTCVYLLMAPESSHLQPKSVILKATSPQGPLELEIPVKLRKDADEMIHQLAARKATKELEEGQGWISDATLDDTGELLREKQGGMYVRLQRREAVRLGVEFQVGGKYCSFVAVEANEVEIAKKRQNAVEAFASRKNNSEDKEDGDWEMLGTGTDTPFFTFQPAVLKRNLRRPRPQFQSTYSASNMIITSFSGGGGAGRSGRGGGRSGGRGRRPGGNRSGGGPTRPLIQPQEMKLQSITKTAPQHSNEEDEDEDMGFGLFDGDDDEIVVAPPRRLASKAYRKAAPDPFIEAEAEIDDYDSDSVPNANQAQIDLGLNGSDHGQIEAFDFDSFLHGGDAKIDTSNFNGFDFKGDAAKEEEEEESEDDKGDGAFDGSSEPTALLHNLISLQTFSGPWPSLSALPLTNLRISSASAFAASKKLSDSGVGSDAEKVLATALVICFLEQKMADEEETWELVVEKARTWLESAVEDEAKREEVWKEAKELVGAKEGFGQLAALPPRKKVKYGLFD